MDKTQTIFEAFKDRGDEYMLICQKRQKDSEPLTILRGGDRHSMLMEQSTFCSSSPWTGGGWGFAFVGMLNTSEPWEEHAAYLRALDFKW